MVTTVRPFVPGSARSAGLGGSTITFFLKKVLEKAKNDFKLTKKHLKTGE